MKIRAGLVTLLVAATFGATAQQNVIPPLAERLEVNVVNVDVTVVDRSGKPTANLTSEDFEIFEDGKLQKVTNFSVIDRMTVRQGLGTSLTPAAPVESGRFRRKALLLIDNHFIDRPQRDSALTAMQKFVHSSYAGDYDWAVVSLSSTAHVVQSFTSDRKAIDVAIAGILAKGVLPTPDRLDLGSFNGNASQPVGVNPDDLGGTSPFPAAIQASAQALSKVDATLRQRIVLQAMRETARAVIETCHAYSAADGKKLIVLVSGGIEAPTPRLADNREEFAITSNDTAIAHDMGQVIDTMIQQVNAANFNIHIINAEGTVSSVGGNFDVGASRTQTAPAAQAREVNRDSIPYEIAARTGGMYLTSNNVGEAIKMIDSVSSTYYSLGYSPSHTPDGKYHRIEVKVKRPGVQVFSRAGYEDESTDQRLEEAVKAPMSVSSPSEGTLPLHIESGIPIMRGQGRDFSVPVSISFPMKRVTLMQQGDASLGRVHVYLSVFDKSEKNIGFHHAVQDVKLTAAQLRKLESGGGTFRYTMNVNVKGGGVYDVVVAVRDELSDETGKATTSVDTRG